MAVGKQDTAVNIVNHLVWGALDDLIFEFFGNWLRVSVLWHDLRGIIHGQRMFNANPWRSKR